MSLLVGGKYPHPRPLPGRERGKRGLGITPKRFHIVECDGPIAGMPRSWDSGAFARNDGCSTSSRMSGRGGHWRGDRSALRQAQDERGEGVDGLRVSVLGGD